MNHYLMTLPLTLDQAVCVHGYLMTAKANDTEGAVNRLLDETEKRGFDIPVPVVLLTTLSPGGVKKVRGVVRAHCPGASELLREAHAFHFSAWILANHPDNALLMKLH